MKRTPFGRAKCDHPDGEHEFEVRTTGSIRCNCPGALWSSRKFTSLGDFWRKPPGWVHPMIDGRDWEGANPPALLGRLPA